MKTGDHPSTMHRIVRDDSSLPGGLSSWTSAQIAQVRPGILAAGLLPALTVLFTGCAGTVAHGGKHGGEQKVVTRNFQWVYVTGSHIPVAVPLDPNVTPLASISPRVVYTPDEIRRAGGPLH